MAGIYPYGCKFDFGNALNFQSVHGPSGTVPEEARELQQDTFDSYAIESAISATAEAAKGADGLTLTILQDHLKALCSLQLGQLKA